jgi:plasmid maintenance system antidote protein VapI
MPEIAGKLAAKIKAAIEADGRSIYALAEAGDLSRKQLGLFMRGESDLTLTTAARLCEVLGLELRARSKR